MKLLKLSVYTQCNLGISF